MQWACLLFTVSSLGVGYGLELGNWKRPIKAHPTYYYFKDQNTPNKKINMARPPFPPLLPFLEESVFERGITNKQTILNEY